MRIRCPACQTIHPDPGRVFTCEGCGRHLAWRPRPWMLRPAQQVLFVPEGTVEPLTLDLEADDSPQAPQAPRPEATATSAPSDQDSLSRAIALVTVLITDDADQDMYTAIASDPTDEPVTDLVFDSAWLAASAVQFMDWKFDGAGTRWLQEMATFAARHPG